ncbi:DUF3889 domain-containing protein [Salipaludibacillus neizhouensis]|uniref:DUF3889 domain-containing protein n=1 Tax=Salipaludibacillus neizhouensis TaxID=885475 RepID=A0A3A9KLH8_9BACI|nr:RlpA-like double-psi beta-barrel domain-containing protein [Salipaludibacillus neizhouensis]RKL65676.1 DUF3889 domain-containing protein [Salipaludibacillus neizhouensis]
MMYQSYYNSSYEASTASLYSFNRQQRVRGEATWTEGGEVTKCGIPWSHSQYMTVAVAANTPYRCGETLIVKNLSEPEQEIAVTVVDQIGESGQGNITLHRKAFEALGADVEEGIIPVEILPSNDTNQESRATYLLNVIQSAYPRFNIVSYQSIDNEEIFRDEVKEIYEYSLLSPSSEQVLVRTNLIFNPFTNKMISIDIKGL